MADLSQISTEELMRMRAAPAVVPPSAPAADLSGISTEQLMRMRPAEKPGVLGDMAKSIPGAVPRAAAGLVGLPQTVMELAGKGAEKVAKWVGVEKPEGMFKPELPNIGEVVTKGYDKISEWTTGAPVYKPKTGPGRVVDLAAQTMIGGPGSMVQKATIGTAAGVTGEGARLVTDNPVAIGVISMLGGGAASLPFILKNMPATAVHDAIKDIKPQDLARAQTLMDDAARTGVRLTGAEAIAQVTGKNSLQDMQRVVEASRKGGPVMQPVMNERPATTRAAVESAADAVAPMPVDPSRTPARLQGAADTAITKARQAGNTAARPYYEKSGNEIIPSATINAVAIESPMVIQAAERVVKDPKRGVFGENPYSVKALNAAKQYLDDVAGSAKEAGRNNEARLASTALGDLLERIDTQVPAYAKARDIVAQNNRNVVDPMRQSPVGDIAGTKGLPAESAMRAQGEILMPQAPRALDPVTIHRTVKTINQQDPNAARDFVRQNVQAIFDESAQNLSGGANQWGGAKFAAQVAGNPRQRDNLQALVESVSSRQTWVGFNRMLEVMEATGKRHAPGSQTAFNQQLQSELSAAGIGAAGAAPLSPNWALSLIGRSYDNWRFGKNTAEMAKILTDPRSVELMTKLAKEAPGTAKAASLTSQILALQAGVNSELPSSTSR